METLLSVTEAAAILKVAPATIYQYVWRRQIPFAKLQGALRFSPSKLQAWIEERSVAPRAK